MVHTGNAHKACIVSYPARQSGRAFREAVVDHLKGKSRDLMQERSEIINTVLCNC